MLASVKCPLGHSLQPVRTDVGFRLVVRGETDRFHAEIVTAQPRRDIHGTPESLVDGLESFPAAESMLESLLGMGRAEEVGNFGECLAYGGLLDRTVVCKEVSWLPSAYCMDC